MSRIGRNPITIPSGVTVDLANNVITVKGQKGELKTPLVDSITLSIDGDKIIFATTQDTKSVRSAWGLMRALVANMIKGVTEGFEKKLELVGVGYRVAQSGNGFTMNIGYSHPVEYKAPEGVTIKVIDNQNITVSGADKQQVGLIAAKIRNIRKPEPYKGKGVKYADEVIRRKAGKSGKA